MPTSSKASPYSRATQQAVTLRRETVRAEEKAKPETPFMEWATRVPEPKAGPLDFDRFPFQREFYDETGEIPEAVVKKATQIGISAYLIRWTMRTADVKGLTVIYLFPKQNLMHDFADARVRPLILASPYLRGRVPHAHTQNKGLRQIGQGFVFYRGSESVDALESVDADALALDEYDSLVAANIPVVERRLSGSPFGWIRRVGVPSIPGFGLDALYEKSDMRRWHVRCDHCKRWQPIFFQRDGHPDGELSGYVDRERALVVCGKCQKPLDVAKGEWVATHPDVDVRGYHASRLIVPAVARNERGMLQGIINASMSKDSFEIQIHHNRDLGEAYAPKEGRLSREAIKAAQRGDIHQQEGYVGDRLVTGGIDVASTRALNVRISEHTGVGRKRSLWIGTVNSFNELEDKLREFGVHMFAIDHLPEGRLARDLCAKFPGRGYMVVLTGSQTQDVFKVDEEKMRITVRRTEALDAMMTAIRGQTNLITEDLPDGYVAQMTAPVRYMEKDELGKVTVGYRSSGPDDYAMSEVFDVVATDAYMYRQQTDAMRQGQIVALEDRLEFSRSHLHEPEEASEQGYHPGPSDGYNAGFGGVDEEGYDSPYSAWSDQ